MQSAFGVEHGDEVSKGVGTVTRAVKVGFTQGRNVARGNQIALAGKDALSVGRAPRAATFGARLGGVGQSPARARVGGANSKRMGYDINAIRARRATAATNHRAVNAQRPVGPTAAPTAGSGAATPGNALAVIPKPASAAAPKRKFGMGHLLGVGAGSAAVGGVGASEWNRRNS